MVPCMEGRCSSLGRQPSSVGEGGCVTVRLPVTANIVLEQDKWSSQSETQTQCLLCTQTRQLHFTTITASVRHKHITYRHGRAIH